MEDSTAKKTHPHKHRQKLVINKRQKKEPRGQSTYLSLYCTLPNIIFKNGQEIKQQVQKFIEVDPFFSGKPRIKNLLIKHLSSTTIVESLMQFKQQYQAIITIFQELLASKTKDIVQKMAQKEKQEYLILIEKNRSVLIDYKGILNKELLLENMVRIDVLALFFKKNNEFKRKYDKINLLNNKLYFNLFKLYPLTIQRYSSKYQEFQPFLNYDYEQVFSSIVNYICLIQLKYKLYLSITQTSQNQRKNAIMQIVQEKQHQRRQEFQYDFKFRFCEVAYTKQQQTVKNKRLSLQRVKIVAQKIKEMRNYDASQQKDWFLRLKYQQDLSIQEFSSMYCPVSNIQCSNQNQQSEKKAEDSSKKINDVEHKKNDI